MAITNPVNYADEYWVEVDLDYADQVAARAEYTLVLIGPSRARYLSPVGKALFAINAAVDATLAEVLNFIQNLNEELKPVGMCQDVNFQTFRGRMPIGELGSAMRAFVSEKTTTVQAYLNRLVASVPSFLKKIKEEQVPDALRDAPEESFDMGLHGRGSKWPFGLGLVFYAELSQAPIGRLYIEACKIQSIGSAVGEGMPVTYEQIGIIGHRIVQLQNS
ncbi:MAG: hypothetical protein GXO39_04235 [Thermotogae bacterium]|nr:hypothetical protein [Thermotogota bacterium]